MVLAARHRMFPALASCDSELDGNVDGFVTDDGDVMAPTCLATHRVADVSNRGVVFVEALAGMDARLRSLQRRIVSAVVRGEPMPTACETLPEIDHLVARIEAEWNETMRDGSRRDPDPEQWSRCLLAATESCFTAWCFDCLCELSGGGLVRIDADGGESGEAWIADEPVLLAEDLATALDGDRIDLVADPLRRPEIGLFEPPRVLQAS
ncbi:MAG: hypothetical protein ACYTDE_06550 [Planctomycetota bacterium]|jgi:hypothetical protein